MNLGLSLSRTADKNYRIWNMTPNKLVMKYVYLSTYEGTHWCRHVHMQVLHGSDKRIKATSFTRSFEVNQSQFHVNGYPWLDQYRNSIRLFREPHHWLTHES
jgi:hypothetical protein